MGQDPDRATTDCPCVDLIGPFEMDGIDHGTYRPSGMWWTVCRGCGKTRSVDQP